MSAIPPDPRPDKTTRVDFLRLEEVVEDLLGLDEPERTQRLASLRADDAPLADLAARLLQRARISSGTDALPTPPDAGLLTPDFDPRLDPLVGRSFGEFRLTRMVGAGGMGRVYEARQQSPDRRVAVKVLSGRLAMSSASRRFVQEGHLLGTLEHPGICRVIAAGTATVATESIPWLAMEFVDGRPLTQAAAGLGTAAKVRLVAEVCDAVGYAHQKGVIHRDLKPANVLVEFDAAGQARPKVVDFGLARMLDDDLSQLTEDSQAILGTVDYMSPEQLTVPRAPPDTRADVYALGLMLFEILAGRRPFAGANALATAAQIVGATETPRLRQVLGDAHPELDLIVAKATSRDLDARYGSVEALAEDLRAHLEIRPIAAHAPTASYRLRKFALRHRGFTAGIGIAVAALILGVVGTLYGLREAVQARDQARAALSVSEYEGYVAAIQAAHSATRLGDLAAARSLLDTAPPRLRGWEWRYLSALCTPESERGPATGGLQMVPFEMMLGHWSGRPLHLDRAGGVMHLVDMDTLDLGKGIPGFSARNPWRSSFTDDGRYLVTAGTFLATENAGLRVFDRTQGRMVAERRGYLYEDQGFNVDRSGTRVVIAGHSGVVRVFSIPDLSPLLEFQDHEDVRTTVFSPDGATIAVSAPPNHSTFVRTADGSVISRTEGLESQLEWPRFSADGTRVYALLLGAQQVMVEVDVRRAAIVRRVVVLGSPSVLATLPDDSRILVATLDGTVHFYPAQPPPGMAWSPVFSLREHSVPINSMYPSNDSRRVFVDSTTESDFVWDAGAPR